MSDSIREGYFASREYKERQEQFDRWLKRRDRLRALVQQKYPEVYDLLSEFYEEKHF